MEGWTKFISVFCIKSLWPNTLASFFAMLLQSLYPKLKTSWLVQYLCIDGLYILLYLWSTLLFLALNEVLYIVDYCPYTMWSIYWWWFCSIRNWFVSIEKSCIINWFPEASITITLLHIIITERNLVSHSIFYFVKWYLNIRLKFNNSQICFIASKKSIL